MATRSVLPRCIALHFGRGSARGGLGGYSPPLKEVRVLVRRNLAKLRMKVASLALLVHEFRYLALSMPSLTFALAFR